MGGCVLGIPHCENPARRPVFPAAQPAATALGHGYRGSPASRRAATLSATWALNVLFAVAASCLRHVLLIDAVLTTGATAAAAGEVFRNAGVEKLSLWTVARTRSPPQTSGPNVEAGRSTE